MQAQQREVHDINVHNSGYESSRILNCVIEGRVSIDSLYARSYSRRWARSSRIENIQMYPKILLKPFAQSASS